MIKEITINKNEIYKGHLLLINQDYPIKHLVNEDYLDKINYRDQELLIDSIVKRNLLKILSNIDGLDKILCTDSYRTKEMQRDLYNNSLIENGKEFTEKYVAKVDCSEHQSALAIDLALNKPNIDIIRPSFPNFGISKEFKDICANYGFIERYKEEKKSITKIAAEEWHFRYVGYPHSKIIKDLGLCLEEYIVYLKSFNQNNPLVFEDYSIYYIKYNNYLKISITKNTSISGNNIDGIIITEVKNGKSK